MLLKATEDSNYRIQTSPESSVGAIQKQLSSIWLGIRKLPTMVPEIRKDAPFRRGNISFSQLSSFVMNHVQTTE